MSKIKKSQTILRRKVKKGMKTLKRVLKILLVIVIALVVGYFIYTGCNV